MALVAKTEPGGAAGLVWEKAGDEGAIEVHPRLARELLDIPGELFYIVTSEVKKAEKVVEEVVAEVEKVVKKPSKDKAAASTSEDVAEALDVASATKNIEE